MTRGFFTPITSRRHDVVVFIHQQAHT